MFDYFLQNEYSDIEAYSTPRREKLVLISLLNRTVCLKNLITPVIYPKTRAPACVHLFLLYPHTLTKTKKSHHRGDHRAHSKTIPRSSHQIPFFAKKKQHLNPPTGPPSAKSTKPGRSASEKKTRTKKSSTAHLVFLSWHRKTKGRISRRRIFIILMRI